MLKSGFLLFLGLLLGRFLGLFRELVLVHNLGTSTTADIIIALITLPDIFISVFVGNSIAAVFTPKITSLKSEKRFGYFIKLNVIFGGIFLALSAFTFFKQDILAQMILPTQANSVSFIAELRWIIWAIPLLALNAISRVFLQAENKFGLLGLENVIFNLCIIGALFLFSKNPDIRTISIAILVGSLFRWLSQVWQIRHIYIPAFSGYTIAVTKDDFIRYNHALFTGILLQILPIYARSIASHFTGDGGLAIFNYSYKFIEFPMALGISIVSLIVYPRLTQAVVEKKHDIHLKLIESSQTFVLMLCIPACILLPALLFKLTKFSNAIPNTRHIDLNSIFISVAIGCSILFIRGLNELYSVILNSLHDVKNPLKSTFLSSIAGLIFIYIFTAQWGIFGGFIGLNVSFIINFFINLWFLRVKHDILAFKDIANQKNLELLTSSLVLCTFFYFSSHNLNLIQTLILWASSFGCVYAFLFRKAFLKKIAWKQNIKL